MTDLDTSNIVFNKHDVRKNLKLPTELSVDLAYLCGVLAGDGNIYIRNSKHDYSVTCVGNPIDEKGFYDDVLYRAFLGVFNIKIKTKHHHKNTTYGFRFSSKTLVLFLTEVIGLPNKRKDNIRIPNIILSDRNATRAFLQGFADTDFCLTFKKKKYPVVVGVSKSEAIINQIVKFLKSEGFRTCKSTRNYYDSRFNKIVVTYEIALNGNSQLLKWMGIIGFRHPKHLAKFEKWKKEIIAKGGFEPPTLPIE